MSIKTILLLKYLITNSSVLSPISDNNICLIEDSEYNYYINNESTFINYENVLQLALMSNNAYFQPNNTKWYDINLNKTTNISYSDDNIHAYMFSNYDNTVNIIAFKGTTIYWGYKGEETIKSDLDKFTDSIKYDKWNDNLYFSCCYYKESNLFDKEDCQSSRSKSKNTCYKQCYRNSTSYSINYINIAHDIVKNVMNMIDFNNSFVVFTGHSLRGTIATMMGLKFNKHVVTFEAPGEKHYIDLIDMEYDQNTIQKIYHFGHNADIIFKGKCNGAMSWCYLGGYNMYTKCHIGSICEYDTKNILGMKESIFTHRIGYVIENVIVRWNNTLPECVINTSCIDCENWNYI